MADLSNSIGPGDASGIVCRPALRSEIEPALRLLLATQTGIGADAQVLDFLSFCVERHIDTNATWIAEKDGRLIWAILPLVQPGKTMLFFTPMVLFTQTPTGAIGLLAAAVCEHYSLRGIKLAQLLIDPADRPIINVYRDAGFHELAELVYLQKSVSRRTHILPALLPGHALKPYTSQTHPLFASVIQRSYEQSLDCPALNGLREMDEVIAGHQATGDYDPKLWSVLCRQDHPVAALLLARVPQGTALELVYLGLSPEARGRGIGDLLMQHALGIAALDGRDNLSLAVDSRNQPALRLYYRHGMKRIGSRVALMRDLRREIPSSPAALDPDAQTRRAAWPVEIS